MKYLVVMFLLMVVAVPNVFAETSVITNYMENSNVNQYILVNCETEECWEWLTTNNELATNFTNHLEGGSQEDVDEGEESTDSQISIINDEEGEEIINNQIPIINEEGEEVDEDVSENEEVDEVVDVSEDQGEDEEELQEEDADLVPEDADSRVSVRYQGVRINEVMSAPETGNKEWIELYNTSDFPISLENWILEEGAGQRTTLFGEIMAHGYLVFEKSSLNNSGDVIVLTDSNARVIDELKYGNWEDAENVAPEKGNSLILDSDEYKETELPTRGQQNIWQVDDTEHGTQNTEQQFDSGTQNVEDTETLEDVEELVVEDSNSQETEDVEDSDEESFDSDDFAPLDEARGSEQDLREELVYQFSNHVRINEFIPNPEGSDDGEWIELYNDGDEDVALAGWSLDDSEGGSSAYDFQDEIIEAKGYLLMPRETTNLALNNSSDSVVLKDPNGEIISQYGYETSKENMSYVYIDDEWKKSSILTPGEENEVGSLQMTSYSSKKSYTYYQEVELSAIKTMSSRVNVEIEGQVIVLPDVYGKSVVYLNGMQVYFSKADWPELEIGDFVKVKGAISESRGEKRVLLKNKTDLSKIDNREVNIPKRISSNDIGEDLVAYFVEIEGELLEKKSSRLYFADENDEFVVYLKKGAGISSTLYNVGDRVKITGILTKYDDEYRVQPRSIDDMENLTWQENVLVGAIVNEDVAITSSNSKVTTLIVLLGSLLVLLCANVYLFRNRLKEGYSLVRTVIVRKLERN